jgi:hypothetical protein
MTMARGWLYPLMALACAVIVFVGFAPTYFLRAADADPLPFLTHVHGLAYTGWVLLLITQTMLIAGSRKELHKSLGYAGAALAVGMVVLGVIVSLASARRGVQLGQADEARSFLLIPLGAMLSFSIFIGFGVLNRARPDRHRRYMLLSTIAILPAAIGRIPALADPGPFLVCFISLLAVVPIVDRLKGRPMSAISVWGGLALVVWELGRFLASETAAWRAVAERLV